jgi:hypothetical protein
MYVGFGGKARRKDHLEDQDVGGWVDNITVDLR